MKSEKAKKFLETKQPGDIAQYEVSLWKAERTAEIAEDEMREKAIETFKWWIVEYYADITDKKLIDKHIQKFTQQLDKQK